MNVLSIFADAIRIDPGTGRFVPNSTVSTTKDLPFPQIAIDIVSWISIALVAVAAIMLICLIVVWIIYLVNKRKLDKQQPVAENYQLAPAAERKDFKGIAENMLYYLGLTSLLALFASTLSAQMESANKIIVRFPGSSDSAYISVALFIILIVILVASFVCKCYKKETLAKTVLVVLMSVTIAVLALLTAL